MPLVALSKIACLYKNIHRTSVELMSCNIDVALVKYIINYIPDGGGKKRPPSLKSVTHILQ